MSSARTIDALVKARTPQSFLMRSKSKTCTRLADVVTGRTAARRALYGELQPKVVVWCRQRRGLIQMHRIPPFYQVRWGARSGGCSRIRPRDAQWSANRSATRAAR